MRNNIEAQHQAAYFQILALNEKKYPQLKWIHASMNGASASSKAAAGQRKAQGQKAGVADIFIPVCMQIGRQVHWGAWLELKIKPNRLSTAQKEFLEAMENAGYWPRTAWSVDELCSYTEEYLGIKLTR